MESKITPLFSDEAVRELDFFRDVRHLRFDDEAEDTVDDVLEVETSEVDDWQATFDALAPIISIAAVGRMLGRKRHWVLTNAKTYGIEPVRTQDESGRWIHGFKKEIILQLREIISEIPMQDDWVTSVDLEKRTGVMHQKVQTLLAEHGVESELRTGNFNNRISSYYPPTSEDIILEYVASQPKQGGDWKTDAEIAQYLNKDKKWVRARTAEYPGASEQRIAANGHILPHYSPAFISMLRVEAEKINSYPQATFEDISLSALTHSLKRGSAWVNKRLPYTMSSISTKRNPANNRPYAYVTPNPYKELVNMPDTILDMKPSEYLSGNDAWLDSELESLTKQRRTLELLGKSLKRRQQIAQQDIIDRVPAAVDVPVARRLYYTPPTPDDKYEETNALSWQKKALCAETDPEAFFPEKGGSTKEAKRICSSCEVSAQCLEYAIQNDERFGIWGGLSEKQRRKLRSK